jgi:hypothetical protein
VWERSTAARPFFEACQHSATRVWSIETQMDNLHDVADYVAKAWHFGGLAETASVAASYPMGSTSNQDAPGEVWNPCHADEEDSSVQVPYVIKWYAASDQLLHLMLGGRTSAAEPKPVEAFHLPMLLDQQEMRLSAPQQTSTLLVGRSGTGKTSIAIEKLYRTAAANAERAAALRLAGGGGGGGGGFAAHVNVLFVCRSRTLCSQVQRHFLELLVPLGEPAVPQEELQAACP